MSVLLLCIPDKFGGRQQTITLVLCKLPQYMPARGGCTGTITRNHSDLSLVVTAVSVDKLRGRVDLFSFCFSSLVIESSKIEAEVKQSRISQPWKRKKIRVMA